MVLDITKFSPKARANQIEIGKRFGSRDTLDQANQTLGAHAVHGAALAAYGFNLVDAERLRDARDLLTEAGVDRDAVRGDKQTTSKASLEALQQGKNIRLRARSILTSVQEDLEDEGIEHGERLVTTVLQQTMLANDTAEGLASQLDLLARVLEHADVKSFTNARGGADTLVIVKRAAVALRAANQDNATRPGTAEQTQRLDQIDGIIVRLVRRARKAAIAASRALRDPALERAFKLDQLYRRRGGAESPDGVDDDGDMDNDNGDIDNESQGADMAHNS